MSKPIAVGMLGYLLMGLANDSNIGVASIFLVVDWNWIAIFR